MDIAVIIRKMPANGYRATTGIPEDLSVDGATPEEALHRIESLIREKMARALVVQLRIPETVEDHPWRRFAGDLKGRPDAEEYLENLRQYREQVDSDPERV